MKYYLKLHNGEDGDPGFSEVAIVDKCFSLEDAKERWAHFEPMRRENINADGPGKYYYVVTAKYQDMESDITSYVFGDVGE